MILKVCPNISRIIVNDWRLFTGRQHVTRFTSNSPNNRNENVTTEESIKYLTLKPGDFKVTIGCQHMAGILVWLASHINNSAGWNGCFKMVQSIVHCVLIKIWYWLWCVSCVDRQRGIDVHGNSTPAGITLALCVILLYTGDSLPYNSCVIDFDADLGGLSAGQPFMLLKEIFLSTLPCLFKRYRYM